MATISLGTGGPAPSRMKRTVSAPFTITGTPIVAGGGGGTGSQGGGGGGASTSAYLFQQPAFDPRIRRLSQPFGTGYTPIQRGHMVWNPQIPWPSPYGNSHQTWAEAPKVMFLYNPSTIAASYQLTDNSMTSALIYPVGNPNNQPLLRVPLQQSVSFTLLFDRTYEMNGGANPSLAWSGQMYNLGVMVDVIAMMQFTGMFADLYAGNNPLSNASNLTKLTGYYSENINQIPNFTGGSVLQGVMQATLCYIYFANPLRGIQYYGYVDSWDVQYTHFAQNMVPMRCVIDVSFTLLPPPPPNNTDPYGAVQLVNGVTGQPGTLQHAFGGPGVLNPTVGNGGGPSTGGGGTGS